MALRRSISLCELDAASIVILREPAITESPHAPQDSTMKRMTLGSSAPLSRSTSLGFHGVPPAARSSTASAREPAAPFAAT